MEGLLTRILHLSVPGKGSTCLTTSAVPATCPPNHSGKYTRLTARVDVFPKEHDKFYLAGHSLLGYPKYFTENLSYFCPGHQPEFAKMKFFIPGYPMEEKIPILLQPV